MNNKELVQQYCKRLWEQRDLSAIDDYFAQDATIKSPFGVKHGSMTIREIADKWLTAFPDLSITWEEFIAEGNRVVSRWSAIGTHLGGFFDTKPTHKEISYSGITIYHLSDGKIAAYWALVDIHAILTQLEEYDSIAEAIES